MWCCFVMWWRFACQSDQGTVLEFSFFSVGLGASYVQPAASVYANAVSGFIACIGGRKSNAAQLQMECVLF